MNGLFVERWWPYVVALLVVAVWYVGLGASFSSKPDGLMAATGTMASVLVGFLATAKTIVLGLTGSPVFKQLKAANYHQHLFRYLYEATLSGIVLLTLSIVGFFVADVPPVPVWFSGLWMLSGSIALLMFIRIVHILFKLLRQA